jgi:histidinol-phosphate/aromatic aminotransferase/cobyric acid decarboxylase-like protein
LSSNIINLQTSSSSALLPDEFPHGGGLEAAARAWKCDVDEILDLSTGLHPDGAPVWLSGWLKAHASLVAHYPDAQGEPARTALAHEFGVEPDNVLITAGAQAVIEVLFQAMGWQSLAIEVPCYNEPIRCAKRAGCRVLPFEHQGLLPNADAIWWTSPSNPFGKKEDFPENCSGLLDESYMPFTERRRMGILNGVFRLGSLTKNLCIPGLRLGYVIANAGSIEKINAWLPPWPTSTLALHLLPKLLPEADRRDEMIVVARQRLTKLLEKNGWQVKPSEASFLLARPERQIPDFAERRILVRRFPEWPQLTGWIRFGMPGSDVAWQRLEEALFQSH